MWLPLAMRIGRMSGEMRARALRVVLLVDRDLYLRGHTWLYAISEREAAWAAHPGVVETSWPSCG